MSEPTKRVRLSAVTGRAEVIYGGNGVQILVDERTPIYDALVAAERNGLTVVQQAEAIVAKVEAAQVPQFPMPEWTQAVVSNA